MENNVIVDRGKVRQDTIDHYLKMMAWVRMQSPDDFPDPREMEFAIGENWYGWHCPYCKEWYIPSNCECCCKGCPLFDLDMKVNNTKACCGGLWEKMAWAGIWREWLERVELVLQFIREKG